MRRLLLVIAFALVGLAGPAAAQWGYPPVTPPGYGYPQDGYGHPRYRQPPPDYGYGQPPRRRWHPDHGYGEPPVQGWRQPGPYSRPYPPPYHAQPRQRVGVVCGTSRGYCQAEIPGPVGSRCKCIVPGFGQKRGAIVQ
jgi:hypothetical protein